MPVVIAAAILYRALGIESLRRILLALFPWLNRLNECCIVGDIRGGDSFSDIYGMRRFLEGFLTAWSVILVRGSIVQFPQTYGPFRSRLASTLARYLLMRSSTIIARDRESQKVAQSLVGTQKTVYLSPDVAFALEPTIPPVLRLEPPLSGEPPSEVIGLNVNALMYHGGYTRANMFGLTLDYPRFLRELVLGLTRISPLEIWLVPHTFAPPGDVESDPDASAKLLADLPRETHRRVRMLAGEYDQHELKGIIGKCAFFVGSRMHACIAALSQGVPCVGVAYSMKFTGVFESVGMKDWVLDGRSLSADDAVAACLRLYGSRLDVRADLKARATAAREQLHKIFTSVLSGQLAS